jgi:hypothetical protein
VVGVVHGNNLGLVRLLHHSYLLLLKSCCRVDGPEAVATTAAWWLHVLLLLLLELTQLLLFSNALDLRLKVWILREKATFLSNFVLSLVECALFDYLIGVAWITGCSTCGYSSNMCRVCSVAVFSLHRLGNVGVVQVHHQIVVDCVLVWRL